MWVWGAYRPLLLSVVLFLSTHQWISLIFSHISLKLTRTFHPVPTPHLMQDLGLSPQTWPLIPSAKVCLTCTSTIYLQSRHTLPEAKVKTLLSSDQCSCNGRLPSLLEYPKYLKFLSFGKSPAPAEHKGSTVSLVDNWYSQTSFVTSSLNLIHLSEALFGNMRITVFS